MNLIATNISNLQIKPQSTAEAAASIIHKKYLEEGNALFNIGKFLEAIDCFDKVITEADNNRCVDLVVEAYYKKSFCFLRLDKLYQAIGFIDTCIALNPNYEIAYVTKGFCLKLLERDNDARKMFEKANELSLAYTDLSLNGIVLNQKYKQSLLSRGLSCRGLREYEKAMENYDKLIELEKPQFENGLILCFYYLCNYTYARL
jgi:tetratricopeptide (TPR) repeat protein